ncbi:MAG: YggU family protein [Chloroflexi bacterium]|jgi:uncharacterized protein|nr:YggU family protein [Chloroflexota bacterium]
MEMDSARLIVQVQPNARRNEVIGFENGVLRIKVTAPPIKGKANKRLIEFLSEVLGVSKSRIEIEKGLTSKRKAIFVQGMTQSQVSECLGNL